MNGILELVNRLGPQRLLAMGAITLALIGFFAFVMTRATAPPMGTLFSDLSMNDSNVITRDLDTRGVKYELRQEGATILVPREQMTKLRLEFAGKGLPAGGSVGYEIFDKTDTFSTTSFVQGINQVRALEGELARTIKGIERVVQARVHLAIPEKKLFERDKQDTRASIILNLRGELDAGQVRAIRHLVASAVQGLKPDRVSIVDETGRLLADGAGSESDPAAIAQDKQNAHERRLKVQIEDIVASVVGRGRARVQVSAEMDFNRIQQVTDTYDPDGRVVRSTRTLTENQQSQEVKDGQVTVANELPGGSAGQGNNPQQREATQRAEEITNFEISKSTKTEIIEAGRVKKLSVAVLVDGIYTPVAGGAAEYRARPPDELERIATLVRSAVGFDRARGDQVEVVNLKFAEGLPVTDAARLSLSEQLLAMTREDVLHFIELGVIAVLTLLVLLLVVRPLLRAMGIGKKERSSALGQAMTGLQSVIAASGLASGAASLPAPGQEGAVQAANSNLANVTAAAGIQAALHQGAVESLGKIVQDNPTEATSIIRGWIAQAH